jgi:DNA-binding transcriptional ArsR family regulator
VEQITADARSLDDAATGATAIRRLGALAHPTRLAIHRLLVEAGPSGLAAGAIAEALGLPAATLSFHVKELAQAGLVLGRPQSRFVIYSADFNAIRELIGYLTENCCGGTGRLASCASACAPDACTPSPARTRSKR